MQHRVLVMILDGLGINPALEATILSDAWDKLDDETREALARYYLASSSLSAAEISFLLGYDDPNSFYRAFHGWTGKTPDGVRSAAVQAVDAA